MMTSYQWDLYDWTVQHSSDEPSTELDDVTAASASGGSSKLNISAAGRLSEMEVTWFFNVTATNWLGGVGWNAFEVGGVHSLVISASRAMRPQENGVILWSTYRTKTENGNTKHDWYSKILGVSP